MNLAHKLEEPTPSPCLEDMKRYKIETFADIIKALKENPEWLEEIRKIILTSELLELPKKFDELLKRVENLEQDVAILKQDVAILKYDVAILKKDMSYLKGEFGRFKGRDFERTIREKYPAYFGRILKKCRLIDWDKLVSIIDDAEDKGIINEEEREMLFNLDIVVQGEIKKTRKPVVLAGEISYAIYEKDLIRAKQRAEILSRLFDKEVIPVVVGVEITDQLEKQAAEKGVLVITTCY
ncbi:MAG: hypothetical protein Q9M37_06420 [Desulfonauticus sp.]|nr:hypothetical protein [Desulfonauticus sp.]